MDVLNPKSHQLLVARQLAPGALEISRILRRFACFNLVLVGTTVISGAFVAGNDAGRAFNTFPKMGDRWIPSDISSMSPWWRNLFENTATVQFDHRLLALTSLTSIGTMYATAMRNQYWKTLPRFSRMMHHAVAGMAATQVSLGIATLLLYVPIELGVVHQFGSICLLTLVTCLVHSLNYSKFGRLVIPTSAAINSAARLAVKS